MRFPFLFLAFFICGNPLLAQEACNDNWIQNNQVYYKIPVGQTGIYRIEASALQDAGINVNGIGPEQWQLFYRGKEQAIHVESSGSGTDFIEFYGIRNDGKLETIMYPKAEWQPNVYQSLYSDTSCYFLTYSRSTSVRGLRMENFLDNIIATNPTVDKAEHIDRTNFTNTYRYGRGYYNENASDIHHSYFDAGEGFASVDFVYEKATNTDFPFVYTGSMLSPSNGATGMYAEIRVSGANGRRHPFKVAFGPDNNLGSYISDGTIYNADAFQPVTIVIPVPAAAISQAGTVNVKLNSTDPTDNSVNRISVHYIALTRTEPMNMGNSTASREWRVPAVNNGTGNLQITNVPLGMRLFDITDSNKVRIISPFNPIGSGTWAGAMNGLQNGGKILSNVIPIYVEGKAIKKAQMRAIDPLKHNYLIIYSSALAGPGGSYTNAARAYSDYRASPEGGSFDTLLVDMTTIADRYGYGIRGPQAIRNFAACMMHGSPRFLMLMGRGIKVAERYSAIENRYQRFNQVPTWGAPGSDVALTSGLGGSRFEPAIPTGRLSVTKPEQLAAYLDKVKEHAAIPFNEMWRKKTVSVSGGLTASELEEIRGYSQNFNKLATLPYFGAKPVAYYKESNSIIQAVDINEDVKTGCSLINIFGHSYIQGSDVDVGVPGEDGLINAGKYPMIILNGCFVGDLFSSDTNASYVDRWMNAKGMGSIAFLANTDEGFPFVMARYVNKYYGTMFNDSVFFAKSLGEQQQEAVRRFMIPDFGPKAATLDSILADQFMFFGDPAVKLFAPPKPDYVITGSDLSFNEPDVTVATPAFNLRIVVRNPGKAIKDSVFISVHRSFSDGSSHTYLPLKFPAPLYADTFLFPINASEAISLPGINRFTVVIDEQDSIPEIVETNNSAVLEMLIPYSGVAPLYPPAYSIVNARRVNLVFQSNNPADKNRSYTLQLDTSANFNSTNRTDKLLSGDALINTVVDLPVGYPDSTVIYWRVAFAGDAEWHTSSFTYISVSSEGWMQSKVPQYNEITTENIAKQATGTTFTFPPREVILKLISAGSDAAPVDGEVRINDVNIAFGADKPNNCGGKGNLLTVLRLDRISLQPKPFNSYSDRPYYYYLCGRQPLSINQFYFSRGIYDGKLNLMMDDTEDGDYLAVVGFAGIPLSGLRPAQKAAFIQMGVDTMQFGKHINGEPFIIFGKKGGAPGSAVLLLPDTNGNIPKKQQVLNYSVRLNSLPDSGTITSPRIGPASKWETLTTRFTGLNPGKYNNPIIQVRAYRQDGRDTLFVKGDSSSVINLSRLNADTFTTISLRAILRDKKNNPPVPPQLQKWIVAYKGVPEGLIDASVPGASSGAVPDLDEGAPLKFVFGFNNISPRAFKDSLLINYVLTGEGLPVETGSLKMRALSAEDKDTFHVSVNTLNRAGANLLHINVNPGLQPELTYTNNVADLSFNVKPDKTNPLLDVAFDGAHIMDGEIVAPRPNITVLLKDENRWLKVNDASNISLSIRQANCPTCSAVVVDTKNDPSVTFTTEASANNARLSWQPKTAFENGRYLLTVSGTDAKGNKAGQDFTVNFEVVNEAAVTNFYPYPNPFSSSTRFVFTLTGSEIPEDIKIQVMTVSGKVVREIMRSELGPIRIGNNISSYAWDGTDEFGDKLANGVYLYRVLVRHSGQDLDKRATAADDTFKHGFGKMYIMR
ncbi:MAG: C25 family cysteine peptidase [Bacteroidota bacterium]